LAPAWPGRRSISLLVRQAGGRCFEAHAHQDIDDTVASDADDVIRGDVNLPPG
jgi:hypothetical protein